MARVHVEDGPAADDLDDGEALVDDGPPPDDAAAPGESWLRLAAAIAVTVVFVFWMFDRAPVSHAGGDSLWIVHSSASLITDGDFDLSEYSELIDAYPVQPPPHLLEIGSDRVDFFPWGASVVAAPFVAGHAVVTNTTGGDFAAELETTLPLFDIENQIAAAIAAVTTGLLMWVLHRRLRSVAWAGGLALTFALGTGVMSTTSRNLWVQGPALLVTVGVLALAQALTERRGPIARVDAVLVAAAALLVVLGYSTRPPLALLGIVMLWLAWDRGRWRLAVAYAAASAGGLVAVVSVNIATYGDWIAPYSRDRLELGRSFPEAFAANLVSPGRGLFVWTPLLLLGVAWCVVRWRDASLFERLLVGWVGLHLVAVSAFPHWWAGATVGPRFMLDVVPALFVLLTTPVMALRATPASGRRSALLAALAVATLWGGFVNVRAGYRMSVMLWNWPSEAHVSIEVDPGRVWDWSDPQFLR